ncbi:MAG: ABC transporter ATP-binding protein [Desulfuromonadaceae bacterium]|nr:ABC transporter ATP-binding protein [Desulfuromonadaceae bacterium]
MTHTHRLLEVSGLEKRFRANGKDVHVLRGINFSVLRGERVAVVGESGSGKTTLMHILGTLDRPSAGKCRFNGEDLFAYKAADLDAFRNRYMGFVFQFHQLLGEFNALENVMMPALISGSKKSAARKQAQILLDQVGLAQRATHKPGQLSGGEQQRVAIARALVLRPQLLIADEPTGNLDSVTSAGIYALLDALHAEYNLTMVLVTHNMELAAQMDRILQLKDGVLAAV